MEIVIDRVIEHKFCNQCKQMVNHESKTIDIATIVVCCDTCLYCGKYTEEQLY